MNDPHTLKFIAYQIFKGMDYCHKNKILHRDMKPQNILVNNVISLLNPVKLIFQNNVVKLIDFGLARNSGLPNKNYTNEVVTLWYRAPDILLGNEQYNAKIDIWSIGCIFAELVTGKPLFKGKNEEQQLKLIYKILGSPNQDEWPELTSLSNYGKFEISHYEPQDLSQLIKLDEAGLDLLQVRFENPFFFYCFLTVDFLQIFFKKFLELSSVESKGSYNS